MDYVNLSEVWWPEDAVAEAMGACSARNAMGDPTRRRVGSIGGRVLRIGARSLPIDRVLRHGGDLAPKATQKRPRTPWRATKHKLAGDGCCEFCGWKPAEKRLLHAHHVVPQCHGGSDEPENLIVLCPNHHAEAHALSKRTRTAYFGPRTRDELLAEMRKSHRAVSA